jgi:hypothetical protein
MTRPAGADGKGDPDAERRDRCEAREPGRQAAAPPPAGVHQVTSRDQDDTDSVNDCIPFATTVARPRDWRY